MIRKIYLDFLKNKIRNGELRWLLSRATQYVLTGASYFAGRPLCGPILGTIVTNYRCNYRCVMCDLPLRDRELRERGLTELDTDSLRTIISDFARLGASGIGFTGGEPLLREDIFGLLAYTKSLGMFSHLNTNAYYLDEKAINRVIEARVDSINVSLDGARPDTHDRIRRSPGAFERATRAVERMNAIRAAKGSPLRIKTVAVLSEENIGETREMVALSKRLGADCIEFIPRQPFLSGRERPDPSPAFLKEVDGAVDFLLGPDHGIKIENSRTHLKLFRSSFRGLESPLRCFAGYNSLAVDCYGEIYPCVPWYNWRRPAGNINSQGLSDFWHSRGYNETRKEISRCRGCYLTCQAELNILFNPLVRTR